jgi:hypothetical protein
MKHILPILTLTTLAAAASAQAAAPSGLSYNRIGLGYDTAASSKGYSLSATALIGGSNFLLGASTTIGGNGTVNGKDAVSLGYLSKNVYAGIDAVVSVASNETYGLGLRKDLGVYNLEAAASFGRNSSHNNVWGAELAYNVSKQVQLAVGYSDEQGKASTSVLSARYNF